MILKLAAWFSQAKLTSWAADHNFGFCCIYAEGLWCSRRLCAWVCVCGRVDRSCSRDREVFWRRKRLVSIQICIRLAQKQHVLRMKGQRVGRNMSAGEAFWFLIVTFKGGRGWSTGKKKNLWHASYRLTLQLLSVVIVTRKNKHKSKYDNLLLWKKKARWDEKSQHKLWFSILGNTLSF